MFFSPFKNQAYLEIKVIFLRLDGRLHGWMDGEMRGQIKSYKHITLLHHMYSFFFSLQV